MKICSYCSNEYDFDFDKCPSCNSKDHGYKCDNCNTKFNSKFCPTCGKDAEDEMKACPKCGKKTHHAFCPHCGANMKAKVSFTTEDNGNGKSYKYSFSESSEANSMMQEATRKFNEINNIFDSVNNISLSKSTGISSNMDDFRKRFDDMKVNMRSGEGTISNSYSKKSEKIVNGKVVHSEIINNNTKTFSRDKYVALPLCIFGGFLGLHKFYEKKYLMGIIYMLTLGLLGIGWIVDIVKIILKPNPYYVTITK